MINHKGTEDTEEGRKQPPLVPTLRVGTGFRPLCGPSVPSQRRGAAKTCVPTRSVGTRIVLVLFCVFCTAAVNPVFSSDESQLLAGFGEVEITPRLDGKPVYLAGFGANRK